VSPPTVPDALWLWLAVAGLGLFHGINPAMGWLFAVALGLYRHSRRVVLVSLIPIASRRTPTSTRREIFFRSG